MSSHGTNSDSLPTVGFEPRPASAPPAQETCALTNYDIWAWRLGEQLTRF